ncbi:MAG: ABC transporter substrate-binding protein [Acetobacter sp.]|nr:ABC transporter substrate-binding protein [Bacteroides sp.]MCM1341658.1 ABC transporter substrate-binding protein [Acetobacter sp.]MCM1434294.1 ABC transporter substrate-binding protein [Clostridiales bacterium]
MKKVLSILLTAVIIICSFAGCAAENKEPVNINAYVINGPTGIGAVQMMNAAENGEGNEKYNFTVAAAPDEIVSKISTGEADIAAVATNMASSLYNKTNGGIKILAVNTMGVLFALNNKGAAINSIADLKGRTIYTTGQGANPEYIINYLLNENGIDTQKDVRIEYKAEGSELVPVWATNPEAVIIAPQPVASSIKAKYQIADNGLDLSAEWNKVADDSSLMMGCIVVRTEFLNENPDAVKSFLEDYEKSVNTAVQDIEGTAALCEKYGIVASKEIAKVAIPNCNICFITGDEMKNQLTGYLTVLYNADPKSVGGKLPGDDFWY